MSLVSEYSWLDRMIHRIAFSSPYTQMAAADMEVTLFEARFRNLPVVNPVFITSLPRAGTTLLLEVFSRLPDFACHRYRDMPFVLAPILWDKLSEKFRKTSELKERAHGDGMMVGYDSPEALEEVMWKLFWSAKFSKNWISLWGDNEECQTFHEALVTHMQKIIALRANGQGSTGRYVSKNNANIARIGLLKKLFPTSTVLVPFRHPLEHAASLHRQHMNFLSQHDADPFIKEYMGDIGHLEFGRLHRPIAFAGMHECVDKYSCETLDYWLAYWVHAFHHIVSKGNEIVLISYERACADGLGALLALGERMNISATDSMKTVSAMFKAPSSSRALSHYENRELLEKALHLHHRLLDLSIV